MGYAEAMTNTPPTVTDELSARLLDRLGPAAMVELTAFIAFVELRDQEQHGARDQVAGLLRCVRDSAGRAP